MCSYFIYMYSYVICVSVVCTGMPSVCHSYVLLGHPYVTRMYSYVIRMSLECTHMSSVCHSYVLVCARMSSVSNLYVLACHPYVTRVWFYHEPFLKTFFRINICKNQSFKAIPIDFKNSYL